LVEVTYQECNHGSELKFEAYLQNTPKQNTFLFIAILGEKNNINKYPKKYDTHACRV